MFAPRPSLLAAGLSLVITGCAPPPAAAPPPPAPRTTARPAPTTSAAPAPAGPTAEERIATWENAAAAKEKRARLERRKLGRFVASRCSEPHRACSVGAVATDEGLLNGVAWVRLVSADKDVDGDGRADLLVTAPVLGAEEHDRRIAVIADRPSGPAEIAVKGVEPFDWQDFEWLDSPAPTLVLRPGGSTFQRQTLTWNGTALVVTDTVLLRWDTGYTPHAAGMNWFLTATAAGKSLTHSIDSVGNMTEVSPPGALMDLRGDGERYYVARFHTYPPPDMGSSLDLEQLVLELRKDGWAWVSAPLFDVATRGDRDKNGVPDFERSLTEVDLATCNSNAPDCDTSPFHPPALITWSGDDLSANTSDLKPVYAAWLTEALGEVASLKTAGPTTDCPTDRLATPPSGKA